MTRGMESGQQIICWWVTALNGLDVRHRIRRVSSSAGSSLKQLSGAICGTTTPTYSNKTLSSPLTASADKAEAPVPRLQDHRALGEWKSVYPLCAIIWIYIELAYLLGLLLFALAALAVCSLSELPDADAQVIRMFLPAWIPTGLSPSAYLWPAILFSGVVGGSAAALKWHYHCAAKMIWHADRRVWRITSPLLSGVLALFVMMLIRSDIVPIFRSDALTTFLSATSFGFLLGLFSDNLLAALQNFANSTLGTLKDNKPKPEPAGGEIAG